MEPLQKMLDTLAVRFKNNAGIGAFVEVLFLLHMYLIWIREYDTFVLTEDSCSNGDFILTRKVSQVKRKIVIEVKAFDDRYIENEHNVVKIKMSKNPIPDHNWEMILGHVVYDNNQRWVRWYRLQDPQRIRRYDSEPDPHNKYKILIRIPMNDLEEIHVDRVYAIEQLTQYISYFYERQLVKTPKTKHRTLPSRSTIPWGDSSFYGSMYGYCNPTRDHKPFGYRTYAQVLR
jgi:hypothetical protein